MRASRLFALAFALTCLSCSPAPESLSFSLVDPMDLMSGVVELRLVVLPGDQYSCSGATGLPSPNIPEVGIGELPQAIADRTLPYGEATSTGVEVSVNPGEYVVLVQGRGPVQSRADALVCSGCARVLVEPAETVETTVQLAPVDAESVCGDDFVGADETCEGSSYGCNNCQTSVLETLSMRSAYRALRLASQPNQKWALLVDQFNEQPWMRILNPNADAVMSPSVFQVESHPGDVHSAGAPIGLQNRGDIDVSASGVIATVTTDFGTSMDPPRLVGWLWGETLTSRGGLIDIDDEAINVNAGSPVIAFSDDAHFLVVYPTSNALQGRLYTVDSNGATASGASFAIANEASTHFSVASTATYFMVAYEESGGVKYRRIDNAGALGEPQTPLGSAGGRQNEPTIALLSDGRGMIAFTDDGGMTGDGDGSSIGGVRFDAEGTPVGAPEVLNSTTAGAQHAPALTANATSFGLAFESGSEVRARMFDGANGSAAFNREAPRVSTDFLVATEASSPVVAAGGQSQNGANYWGIAWINEAQQTVNMRVLPLP